MCSVWINEQAAKEKVGKGEQGLPRMVLSLGKQQGEMKNVIDSSQQQGSKPRNSCNGITRGRSRWTLLENKTMQPTLSLCVIPQRGDANRRESKGSNLIYGGSWNKFRAPDPEPSSEQAIFFEGPL